MGRLQQRQPDTSSGNRDDATLSKPLLILLSVLSHAQGCLHSRILFIRGGKYSLVDTSAAGESKNLPFAVLNSSPD